jgi:SAM-dependent methyltransferase
VLAEPPERFDPERMGGTLIAAEHLVRYWWARQGAEGADVLDAACGVGFGTELLAEAGARSVTGIDLSDEAVEVARRRCGSRARVEKADVRELPLEDDSVDLAVCFETIEHVTEPERAIAELRRLLRPGGTLVISSPNRGVSTPGNPHHVRELTSGELRDALLGSFAHVELFAQQSWFASALVTEGDRDGDPARELDVAVRTDEALAPGAETYVVALAGDGPPPGLTRGGAFLAEPRGPDLLHEEIRHVQRRAYIERERAERLSAHLDAAREALEAIKTSPSWRLTAPLRSLKHALRRR